MAEYIITAIAMIIVAVIEWRSQKDRKEMAKIQKEVDIKSAQREKESRLSMQMMDASLQLSVVTANALTGGHNNGNVEAARQAAQEASAAYKAFLMEAAAHQIN